MSKNTPEVYHQRISTAFHTMIALPLAAFVYLFLEKKHNELQPLLIDAYAVNGINISLTLLAAIVTYLAYRNFRHGVQSIAVDSLKEKLTRYGKISIQAYLYVGLAFVILVVGLIQTTSVLFIVFYVVLLFLLSLQRPTPAKYIRDLALEGEEKTIVRDKLEFKD